MKESIPLVDLSKAILQPLKDPVFANANITVDVLRLDQIHPVISGNKWFKLKYSLIKVRDEGLDGIITQGGAYSNHLLATAFACHGPGLKCIGLIRGEEPKVLSPTLLDLQQLGMQLEFINREEYRQKDQLKFSWTQKHSNLLWVEEGGQGKLGVLGSEEILDLVNTSEFSHILCAVGTGTMLAGIINGSKENQKVVGITVLKISDPKNNDIEAFLQKHTNKKNYEIKYEFHEGGYAKINSSLLQFMNDIYSRSCVPTDFVYTGKLMKAVYELVITDYFQAGTRVLVIHSGGLQGNRSLEPGSLVF